MTNLNLSPESSSDCSSNGTTDRRHLLIAAAAVAATLGINRTGLSREVAPDEASGTPRLGDRRFKRAFLRAIVKQRRKGEIGQKQFTRFKSAINNGIHIAGSKGGKRDATFATHLRKEVAKLQSDKQVATGLFFGDEDDESIFDFFNLDFQEIFNGLTNWLIENWPTVLKLVITLLIFMEAAENAVEED